MSRDTLEAALSELLMNTGATAARVLDGRTGAVLAEVGATAEDDPAALVGLAAAAAALSAAGGGFSDLVLTARRSLHVLRGTAVPGFVLHLRLDDGRGDLAAGRHELAAVAVDTAVCAVLPAPITAPPSPDLPDLPRRPRGGGDPALAALGPGGPSGPGAGPGSGELAVLALGPVVALPRRSPTRAAVRAVRPTGGGATPAVLQQAWADDLATLRRLLASLRAPGRFLR